MLCGVCRRKPTGFRTKMDKTKNGEIVYFCSREHMEGYNKEMKELSRFESQAVQNAEDSIKSLFAKIGHTDLAKMTAQDRLSVFEGIYKNVCGEVSKIAIEHFTPPKKGF